MPNRLSRPKRAYGTGRLYAKHGSYYGQWWFGGRRLHRKLGAVRTPHTKEGLTRRQAEARLRALMEQVRPSVDRLTFDEAARRHIDRLEMLGRKRSTISDYRSIHRVHLSPEFGSREITEINRTDVERLMTKMLRDGKKPKTVRNTLACLHGIFQYALKHEWLTINPASLVDKPVVVPSQDLRYLTLAEVDWLIEAVADDELGEMERVLYRTAAMTGLRQGELLGLRWMDVDWSAQKIRVRQSYSRGQKDTPKTRLSSRSVPLADQVASELEHHFMRSRFHADDDLVFGNPQTGGLYDRSKCRKRFIVARDAAGISEIPFRNLRHTFGTRMAMAGVPMRTLMEWMGHRDIQTTMIYAAYTPGEQEAELVARAFDPGSKSGSDLLFTRVHETA